MQAGNDAGAESRHVNGAGRDMHHAPACGAPAGPSPASQLPALAQTCLLICPLAAGPCSRSPGRSFRTQSAATEASQLSKLTSYNDIPAFHSTRMRHERDPRHCNLPATVGCMHPQTHGAGRPLRSSSAESWAWQLKETVERRAGACLIIEDHSPVLTRQQLQGLQVSGWQPRTAMHHQQGPLLPAAL